MEAFNPGAVTRVERYQISSYQQTGTGPVILLDRAVLRVIITGMRGCVQLAVASAIACVVMVILVSPAVPSPPTTLPSSLTVQRPDVSVHIAAIPSITGVFDPGVVREMVLVRSGHPTASGCDIVDVTAARLC